MLVGSAVGTLVTIFVAFQREVYTGINYLFGAELNTTVVISFLWPAAFGFLATLLCGYALSLFERTSENNLATAWTWANIMRAAQYNSTSK